MASNDVTGTTPSSSVEQEALSAPNFLLIQLEQATHQTQTTFWIVPTTHEDLSWYTTAVRTALRVAEHKDGILKHLIDDSSARFTFEQAGAVQEYIQGFRPEKKQLLERFFSEGRVEVIGSQIQPEIFLGTGEAFFWNLQAGRETCRRLGFEASKALYIPDTFGFPSSMPKMLRAAGIDNLIFSRGLGDEARQLGAVFNWVADDGSCILAVPIPDGYGNGNKLGRWTVEDGEWKDLRDRPDLWSKAAADRMRWLMSMYGKRYRDIGLPHVLICNGSDFEEIDIAIREIVKACQVEMQEDMPGVSFRFATFEQYLDAIKESLDLNGLKTFSGELRGALEMPILRGVESARIPLKQALQDAERVIYAADALTALSLLKGRHDPEITYRHDPALLIRSLDWAKKTILPVYSHDAICGCGTDEVYYDMHQRIRDARDIADQVRRDSLANLAGTRDIYSYRRRIGESLSVVNTLPYPVRRVVEIPLAPSLREARGLQAETDGHELAVQIVRRSGKRLAAVVVEVDGFGSTPISLKADNDYPTRPRRAKTESVSIENEFYRVDAMPDGTVRLIDRRTGQTACGHLFEEQADLGDEYDFCPLEGNVPLIGKTLNVKARVMNQGPVLSELRIDIKTCFPRRLRPDRKARSGQMAPAHMTTHVQLAQGIDRIDFKTTVENRSEDHRIRVLFRTPALSETVLASEPFTIEDRPISRPTQKDDWCEQPQDTSHNQGMIAAGGLALLSKGLPEYEAAVSDDGKANILALTLLRGVGWLSRSDLSTRKGEAGPFLETPDAQCLGTHTFEYAVTFCSEVDGTALLKRSSDYRTDLEIGPAGVDLQEVLNIDGNGWEISALKPCYDGTGAILRIYNPSRSESRVGIRGGILSAQRYRADDETPIDDTDSRSFVLAGGQIITLKLS